MGVKTNGGRRKEGREIKGSEQGCKGKRSGGKGKRSNSDVTKGHLGSLDAVILLGGRMDAGIRIVKSP